VYALPKYTENTSVTNNVGIESTLGDFRGENLCYIMARAKGAQPVSIINLKIYETQLVTMCKDPIPLSSLYCPNLSRFQGGGTSITPTSTKGVTSTISSRFPGGGTTTIVPSISTASPLSISSGAASSSVSATKPIVSPRRRSGQLPPQNPVCKKDKRCSKGYNNKHPEYTKHVTEWRHSCLHGSTCDKKTISPHSEQFTHNSLPPCTHSNCTQLSSEKHRESFSHLGMWDFLLPCKNGKACDIKSCDTKKYHHNFF